MGKLLSLFVLCGLMMCVNGYKSLTRLGPVRCNIVAFSEIDAKFQDQSTPLTKLGTAPDRPDQDLDVSVLKRYKEIEFSNRKAAATLKSTNNAALAEQLEDLADELSETHEKFVRLAETWNVWSRPSADQPKETRENTSSSAVELLQRARLERPDYELPSELRVLKYKHMVEVEKMTATVLKKAGAENYALAEQLEDMALEMQEVHEHFVEIAKTMKAATERSEKSVSKR